LLGKAGRSSWRGAVYFFSASRHFAQLNSIAVLFDFAIDVNARDMEIKYYEWKSRSAARGLVAAPRGTSRSSRSSPPTRSSPVGLVARRVSAVW
jgi:hypothetical protein